MIRILCADISSADMNIYRRLYERAAPERKARADRYFRQEDKLRCVTADALLKIILGTSDYEIEKNRFGKPRIKDKQGFCYNISHSGRYVVIAWGTTEIGVDVQQHENINHDAIARRFFTPDEYAYAQGSPQRFYEIWTGKESYLKYTGRGLCKELYSFSVLRPEGNIRYLYHFLPGGYSLSLCTTELESEFELLDILRLL